MLHIVLKKIMTNTRLQIRFGFRVILNNQGLGRCYQPQPSAGLITHTSTLIIPHIIRKTSSNNCLVWSRDGALVRALPLPPMWPGFKSWHQRHEWVEFVLDSLLCSKRFFSSYIYSSFPLSPKTIIFKFQFEQERQTKNFSVDGNPKCANCRKAGA